MLTLRSEDANNLSIGKTKISSFGMNSLKCFVLEMQNASKKNY